MDFAEPDATPSALSLVLESERYAEWARGVELPPLQSVAELTNAYKIPTREGIPSAAADVASSSRARGRQLLDGAGVLADGTRWEKKSGEERGEGGFWKRWTMLRGLSGDGQVEWEEHWWEASDLHGMKELGAMKSGANALGARWHESWSEKMYITGEKLDTHVERVAHKWAHTADGDEWEEQWSEKYCSDGHVDKWADKWAKAGPNVWHEKWGENYDGGNACIKWTDKWAERLLPDGAREQWGDKWHEEFAHGRGKKNGEVWSVSGDGSRYQRWWGEEHRGDGTVRRSGHSTGGEHWDNVEHMDTYYNPIPHFGFKHALDHSPTLRNVRTLPVQASKVGGGLGLGVDSL